MDSRSLVDAGPAVRVGQVVVRGLQRTDEALVVESLPAPNARRAERLARRVTDLTVYVDRETWLQVGTVLLRHHATRPSPKAMRSIARWPRCVMAAQRKRS